MTTKNNTLIQMVLPGSANYRYGRNLTENLSLASKVLPYMYCDPQTSLPMRALLAKIGLRDLKAIRAMTEAYFKHASATEKDALATKPMQAKLKLMWDSKFEVSISFIGRVVAAKGVLPRRGVVVKRQAIAASAKNKNTILLMLVKIYSMLSMRVCASLGLDHAKSGQAVLGYLLFGTSALGPVPTTVKRLFPKPSVLDDRVDPKAPKVAPSTVMGGLTIDKLKLKHFKGDDAQRIVDALPEMYKEFIKDLPVRKRSFKVASTPGSSYRRARQAKADREAHTQKIADVLEADVGSEIFGFLEHLIPALKANASKRLSDLKTEKLGGYGPLAAAQYMVRSIRRDLLRNANTLTLARKTSLKKRLVTYNAKVTLLKVNEVHEAEKVARSDRVKAWMLPFLDSSVDIKAVSGKKVRVILGDGILIHRLVTKANSGSLKPSAPELLCSLDAASVVGLTYKGIAKIIEAQGDSTVKCFTSVFKDIQDFMKPKVFTLGITDSTANTLVTPTGNVTSARLLRLNSITAKDESAVVARYEKHLTAWKPLKQEIADFVNSIKKTTVEKAHAFNVTKSSPSELEAARKAMPMWMTNLHNVNLRIMSSWEVAPAKALAAVLSNAKKSKGSKLEVIRDVFHGTSRQTGSIILSCGFKVEGTQVTARSMGDVLYVAPNIDKSAQYMKAEGGYSRASTTGLIFMGDAIVSGTAKASIKGKGTGFNWTHTSRFATSEIGLASPNTQFVIRKAFLVKILPKAPSAAVRNASKSFKTAVPIATYLK